jgi:hypothetical protein
MSATDQKQKLGGHTQLFGEQLVTLKDLHEFKNELLLEVKKSLKENTGQPTKKWLKTNEVCKILCIFSHTALNPLKFSFQIVNTIVEFFGINNKYHQVF